MNAGRLLRDVGLDTPDLRARVAPIDPDDVGFWPAAPMLRKLWRPGIRAVTLWRWVLVDPALMRGSRQKLANVVIHEMVHLRQFAELGYLKFMWRYITEYLGGRLSGLAHREAYLAIDAEMEARETTEQVLAAT